MCTLVAGVGQSPTVPLWVAANRDELLARPARGPERWPGEDFVAPRDEQAGGTWLGLNRHGLFVGVTNRYPAKKDDARDSRGTLVVEALRHRGAAELHRTLAALSPLRFNAFHLLYADAAAAYVTWSDGDRLFQQALPPGVHIVTERSLGGDDRHRTEAIRAALARVASPDGVPGPDALQQVLMLHDAQNPVGASCVHVPEWGYGTRSSMVLQLHRELARSRWLDAPGPPCTTPYRERPDLISALGP